MSEDTKLIDIPYGASFLSGATTNILADTLTDTVMAPLNNAESAIFTAVDKVKNFTAQTTASVVQTSGAVLGATTGAVIGITNTLGGAGQAMADATKIFTQDMTTYVLQVGTYIGTYAVNKVVTFPVDFAKRVAKKYGEIVQEELKKAKDEILRDAESNQSKQTDDELKTKQKKTLDEIKNIATEKTTAVKTIIDNGLQKVNDLNSYLAMGQEWVEDKLSSIEDNIRKEVGEFVDKNIVAKIQNNYEAMMNTLLESNVVVKVQEFIKPVIDLLKKAAKAVATALQKVLIQVKILVITVLLKLLSLIGG